MHHLLETSLPQYTRTVLKLAYAQRYHALMSAVKEERIPLGVVVPPPEVSGIGGDYFVWLTLTRGIDAEVMARKASDEEALALPPGSICHSGILGGRRAPVDKEQSRALPWPLYHLNGQLSGPLILRQKDSWSLV